MATTTAEKTVKADSDESTAPAAAPFDMAQLAVLISGAVGEQMDALRSELRAELAGVKAQQQVQQRATPSFRPMEPERVGPNAPISPQEARAQAFAEILGGEKGQATSGRLRQLPIGTNGLALNESLYHLFAPRFDGGVPVRINPESVRPGFPEGTTWGDILAKVRCAGEGVVQKQLFLDEQGDWRYLVRVPGLTNKQGDSFYDFELLPAA